MLTLNTKGIGSLSELEKEIQRFVALHTGQTDIKVHLDGYDRLRISLASKQVLDFYFNKLYEVHGSISYVGLGMAEIYALLSTIHAIELTELSSPKQTKEIHNEQRHH